MPDFVVIGKHWINVDSIRMVDEDYKNDGTLICTIHFADGDTTEFHGDEGKKLIEVMKKSKVN